MPIEVTDCGHCGKKETVLSVDDAKHDRTIYVCMECNWWGTDAANIAYPLPEKARVKIVWPLGDPIEGPGYADRVKGRLTFRDWEHWTANDQKEYLAQYEAHKKAVLPPKE